MNTSRHSAGQPSVAGRPPLRTRRAPLHPMHSLSMTTASQLLLAWKPNYDSWLIALDRGDKLIDGQSQSLERLLGELLPGSLHELIAGDAILGGGVDANPPREHAHLRGASVSPPDDQGRWLEQRAAGAVLDAGDF